MWEQKNNAANTCKNCEFPILLAMESFIVAAPAKHNITELQYQLMNTCIGLLSHTFLLQHQVLSHIWLCNKFSGTITFKTWQYNENKKIAHKHFFILHVGFLTQRLNRI